jgi:hypothetical protein
MLLRPNEGLEEVLPGRRVGPGLLSMERTKKGAGFRSLGYDDRCVVRTGVGVGGQLFYIYSNVP